MKAINYILCALLVIFYVNALPTVDLSKREIEKRANTLTFEEVDKKLGLKIKNISKYNEGLECKRFFNKCSISYLNTGESQQSSINNNNVVFVCKNTKEYPVIEKSKIKYTVNYARTKDKYGRNVMLIYGCSGNDYVVIKCKKN